MLKNLLSEKRAVICTFIALASGFFGAYVGGQISIAVHTQQCSVDAKQGFLSIPGMKNVCEAFVTPGSLWQGSSTGLWTGAILGAFIAGLATRETTDNKSN